MKRNGWCEEWCKLTICLKLCLEVLEQFIDKPSREEWLPQSVQDGALPPPPLPPGEAQCRCLAWERRYQVPPSPMDLTMGFIWDSWGGSYLTTGRAGNAAHLCFGWGEVAHLTGQREVVVILRESPLVPVAQLRNTVQTLLVGEPRSGLVATTHISQNVQSLAQLLVEECPQILLHLSLPGKSQI